MKRQTEKELQESRKRMKRHLGVALYVLGMGLCIIGLFFGE
jgi:hypothetical protein